MTQKTDSIVESTKICVVGLGYVGLPLATRFGNKGFTTVGFDINESKVSQLQNNLDLTGEVESALIKSSGVTFTTDPACIADANFIIVVVPTPVDKSHRPDISLLKKASQMVGKYISKGSTVVYESTVYPGCTEDDCVPELEKTSGLTCGVDWFVGYSPERINPGDKKNTIESIIKVVSGCDEKTLNLVSDVYSQIITAGTHKASSIKVAEACKVVENTQRDVNIALMNEIAVIMHKLGISTKDVLAATATKWNALNFYPGLVGGHCIGVDPYYIASKAEQVGLHPEIISAARKVNNSMPQWIVNNIIKDMIAHKKNITTANILLLGLTFKENVKDVRNSKTEELISELESFGVTIYGCDPQITNDEIVNNFGIKPLAFDSLGDAPVKFDAVLVKTGHSEFKTLDLNELDIFSPQLLVFDIPGIYAGVELGDHITHKTM